jgi:uncharacterized membrane protein
MSRSFFLSVVALVPLFGVGGVAGSWLYSPRPAPAVASPVSIDPFEIQLRIDVRKLPEQQIADFI